MIGWLKGQIVDKQTPGQIILNVGGVGYTIEVSLPTFFYLESIDNTSITSVPRDLSMASKDLVQPVRDIDFGTNCQHTSGGEVTLFIHTLVREDAIILFGFLNLNERSLFRALIKINGIGPKVALAILSNLTPYELYTAINEQNLEPLTKISGVGKKTAERLLIEMKDKIQQFNFAAVAITREQKSSVSRIELTEAISALESLGYKRHDALGILNKVDDQKMTCEQLIRQALKFLYVS